MYIYDKDIFQGFFFNKVKKSNLKLNLCIRRNITETKMYFWRKFRRLL